MVFLKTPLTDDDIKQLSVGDVVSLSGYIFTGRDAVLPKIVKAVEADNIEDMGFDLTGSVVFHTAVSPAGVGPTSSNKVEIEESFEPLSRAGVKMHLGKGKISQATIQSLKEYNAVFAVIPPVTALLESLTSERLVVAYPELGMEAFYRLEINDYQVIIAAANGESIYDK